MILDDINSLNGVLVSSLHVLDSIDYHLGVEVVLRSDDLGTHAGLGTVDQTVLAHVRHLHAEVLSNVLAGFATGDLVAAHDAGGVELVLDQVVGSLEEFGGHDDDRGGSVADFLVLELGKLDDDLGRRVLDVELAEDGGAVVGDGDVSDVVNQHFVETRGS
jgi:hypothetical protein